MTLRMGENISREWDAEPLAGELWEALQAMKQNRDAGMLTLAENGSGLAMMYLGHAYASSDDQAEMELGQQWLIRSADKGSTEGRYQLAHHYFRQRNWIKALPVLKGLAESGYSPAMYALGSVLYRGDLCNRSVGEAVRYLKMAKDAGHLPSVGLLSRIYRNEKYGLGGRVASHWLCLAKIPAIAWYVWHYPSSDRLRGLPKISDEAECRLVAPSAT
ncbi:MAG: hypothetical protein JWO15_110 [Sphingomonadales bacterium]|nr:hypothetical protein [Sphingomonadales bacterium]